MPDARYFDSPRFSLTKLTDVLRAKAVLCPKLLIEFLDVQSSEEQSWYYENGLPAYLTSSLIEESLLPKEPFIGHFQSQSETLTGPCVGHLKTMLGLPKAMSTLFQQPKGHSC